MKRNCALGIVSLAELSQLATIYADASMPLSIWRVPMMHFTGVDLNWPAPESSPPNPPLPPPPPPPAPAPPLPVPVPCLNSGSIIECENQILAQQLPVDGTPFSLRYQSNRTPGAPTLTVAIPLTGSTVPQGLAGINVFINIAGTSYRYQYQTLQPNQTLTWTWDRLDAYGNTVQGMQTADIEVEYGFQPPVYEVVQCGTAGTDGGATGDAGSDAGTCELFGNYAWSGTFSLQSRTGIFTYAFPSTVQVGVQDAEPLGLGGWTLSANDVYDPSARILWGGDGTRRTLEGAALL